MLTPEDRLEMHRLIHKTAQDGIEHGFLKCPAFPAGPFDNPYQECIGDECSIRLQVPGCVNPAIAFHTHPVKERFASQFSLEDLKNTITYNRGVSCIGYHEEGKPAVKCVNKEDLHTQDIGYTELTLGAAYIAFKGAGEKSPLPGKNVYDLPNEEFFQVLNEFNQKVDAAMERLEYASKVCEEILT